MGLLLLGGLYLASVFAKTAVTASNMQSEYEEDMTTLERSRDDLLTGKENLESDYTAQVGSGLIDVDEYLSDPSFDIANVSASEIGLLNYDLLLDASESQRQKDVVTTTQQKNLSTSATSQSLLSSLETQQIAVQNVQASEAEGQAMQAVATTGFRNTGSAQNVVKQQQYYNKVSMNSLKGQINITRFNRYNDALSAYTQAEVQKANYDAAIENQTLLTKANIEESERQYTQGVGTLDTKLETTNEDIEKLEDYGENELYPNMALMAVGNLFSGIGGLLSL